MTFENEPSSESIERHSFIDNSADDDDVEPPPSRSTWSTVEATGSVFFAFAVGFVITIAAGSAAYASWKEPQSRWIAAAAAALIAAEGTFLLRLKWSLEHDSEQPFIPAFALRQWRWPVLLRPMFSVWWTAHLLVGAGAMWLLEQALVASSRDGMLESIRTPIGVLRFVAILLGAWMVAHGSLLYLLLAITALRRDEPLIRVIWQYRLLADVVLATAGLLLARSLGLGR